MRQDHEPPSATHSWSWRYHHTGIPTDQPREGECYLAQFKRREKHSERCLLGAGRLSAARARSLSSPEFRRAAINWFSTVMYIHGGGWMGGDRHRSGPFVDFPGVLASLSARGYIVTSIEYRLSSEAKFPAPAQDVKAALRWLRLNAAKYNIDPGRGELVCSSQSSSCKALSSIGLHIAQQSDRLGVTEGHGNE